MRAPLHALLAPLCLTLLAPARAHLPEAPPPWRLPASGEAWMRTPYSTIKVFMDEGLRCMGFDGEDGVLTQSCADPNDPEAYGAEYVGMMFAASGLLPRPPRRILVLGLGGGSLSRLLRGAYPSARVDVVDIDPGVVQVARYYFGFRETERVRAHVMDARAFVRAQAAGTYDLIYIDCFDAEYIPPHLLDLAFFREAARLLAPEGLLAANLFWTHPRYVQTLKTWRAVFPELWRLKGVVEANSVVVGSRGLSWASQARMEARVAETLGERARGELRKAKRVEVPADDLLSGDEGWVGFQERSYGIDCRSNCCGLSGFWRGSILPTRTKLPKTRVFIQASDQAGVCLGTIYFISGGRAQVVEDFQFSSAYLSFRIKGILISGVEHPTDDWRVLYRDEHTLEGVVLHPKEPESKVVLRRIRLGALDRGSSGALESTFALIEMITRGEDP